MDWIGASLAFATTMLALSIVVTSTVETIHRLFRLRERGLRLMLQHFYDATLAKHVERVMPGVQDVRSKFLEMMTSNRAPAGEGLAEALVKKLAGDAPKTNLAKEMQFVSRIWNGRRLGALQIDDFMGRLGDSPVGDALASVATDVRSDVDAVLRDLAHKFDEFGRDTTVYFEARARLLAVIVALVLAWQGYVHPYQLFSTFLRHPEVAEKVNARTGQMIKAFDERQAQLALTLQKVQTEPTETNAAKVKEELEAVRSQMSETIDSLAKDGVPIGWSDARMTAAGFTHSGFLVYPKRWDANALTTVAWLLLGGILVGLGGPFWRDLAFSLTSLRGGAETEKRKAEAGPDTGAGAARITAATGRFLTASRARGVVTGDVATEETDVPVG